ncbi:MAG: hypothetical protein M3137_12560, partial [Actinomycetota bacterium]|nr:hypothetical protein [Actinomycetota bacterium]
DHFGATLLVMVVVAAFAFAVVTSQRPVTDTEVEPRVPADAPPPSMQPVTDPGPTVGASAFPLVAAAGLVVAGVAAAAGSVAFYLAVALLLVAAGGWLGQAFAEHPLATPRFGDRISRRATSPFTYPMLAVLLGAVVAISVSRVYLAVNEKAAIVVSGSVATLLFLGCLALASGRNVGRRLTAGLAGVALVSVVGAGAASAAKGERTIEKEGGSTVTKAGLHAQGIQYDTKDLTITEGKVRFTFANGDPEATYHDVGIYSSKEAGTPYVAILPIRGGAKASKLIDTKVVGLVPGETYWFRCDFHPAMVGQLHVEAAPPKDSQEKVGKP